MTHYFYKACLTIARCVGLDPFAGKLNDVTHSGIFWPQKWPFIIGNTSNKNEECFTLHDTAPSKGEGIPEHRRGPLGGWETIASNEGPRQKRRKTCSA